MTASCPIIRLRKERDRSIRNRHPWVFSGAIDERSLPAELEAGQIVELHDAGGSFLAKGSYHPASGIRIRLLSWDPSEALDDGWWRARIERSLDARSALAARGDLDAYRLVNAENDGLPGLVVDRYGAFLTLQALTPGIERVKSSLVEILSDLLHPEGIWERSDTEARAREGLEPSEGLLAGVEPPAEVEIVELGVRQLVDLRSGHKTGAYLDQRDARAWLRLRPEVSGREVLNAFSYTGGFTLSAVHAGASAVVEVESSRPALELARKNLALNGLERVPVDQHRADVFRRLRHFRDAERRFGVVVLDPPKFATSAKQVRRAARGYQDINRLAFGLVEPGGLLLTFSCSGHISPELFGKIVFSAAAEAEVVAQVIHVFDQPEDHPVRLAFPEGRYLKGLACRVEG